MSEDDTLNLVLGVGVLVLVLSSLSLRRMSIGLFVRSLLGWAAIIGLIYLAVINRDPIEAALGSVGERLGISGQSVEGDTVRIRQSTDGHFYARVAINGHPVRMLIDSGATITALSVETAERAGIDTAAANFPVLLNTANGTVAARRGVAKTVSIGGQLETRDLSVVVSPNFGDVNVIGMNFLSRLGSWRVEQQTLILEPNRAA
ncbi:retropepsin-like aspartic protease family protein [Sphingomonas sp. 37zxx]|uniref:retropepsin-like aspartic protease family protein n=1 Tax=Sphingomonas sp. 37zxx TaxID=1550073 RepID=UPI00053BF583|nr:TIGR02281 family clan AA aspartic protease [Sphingomonas sp. 37zxx]